MLRPNVTRFKNSLVVEIWLKIISNDEKDRFLKCFHRLFKNYNFNKTKLFFLVFRAPHQKRQSPNSQKRDEPKAGAILTQRPQLLRIF